MPTPVNIFSSAAIAADGDVNPLIWTIFFASFSEDSVRGSVNGVSWWDFLCELRPINRLNSEGVFDGVNRPGVAFNGSVNFLDGVVGALNDVRFLDGVVGSDASAARLRGDPGVDDDSSTIVVVILGVWI